MTTHLKSEIETLLAEWAFCVDDGRATQAIDLFTDQAEQAMPTGLSVGKEAILAGLRRRQDMTQRTSRHLVSNLRIQEAEPNKGNPRVRGQWILLLFRSDTTEVKPTPQLVADVTDEYENVKGCWLIARRKVAPVFGSP